MDHEPPAEAPAAPRRPTRRDPRDPDGVPGQDGGGLRGGAGRPPDPYPSPRGVWWPHGTRGDRLGPVGQERLAGAVRRVRRLRTTALVVFSGVSLDLEQAFSYTGSCVTVGSRRPQGVVPPQGTVVGSRATIRGVPDP